MNIRFQMSTVDGEVIQAIALKQVCDSFSKHQAIDYDKVKYNIQ